MNQRTAFIITIMVTSFVLVAVGGVTASIANRPASPQIQVTEAPTDAPTPTIEVGVDPAVVAEREAQYQQAIAQANQQLEHAYFLQKSLADELANEQPTPTPKPRVYVQAAPTAKPAPTYAVSPQLAMSLALGAVPGAVVQSVPELVLFAGVPAYEVILDKGKVYIDANTGLVLYNGAITIASGGGGGDNGGNNGGGASVNNPPPPQQQSVGGDDNGGEREHQESESRENEGGDD
jgi:uncharacterized membrane protein YkoI